uniref:Uncharacterized protein n=1 Tax=Plectus sambesii TaxID=2011161 RepID=A0A914UNF4_9BILA
MLRVTEHFNARSCRCLVPFGAGAVTMAADGVGRTSDDRYASPTADGQRTNAEGKENRSCLVRRRQFGWGSA